MNEFLQKIAAGQVLTQEEAEAAMHQMMQGKASPEELAGFLLGIRARGETVEELTGFVRAMRAYAVPVELKDRQAIDVCGTGGDQTGTFNISTTVAFVCAGAGVTVAKHGNRSISSKSGSADVLEALGARVNLGKEGVEYCLEEVGIAFIFAPLFHPAMRHVMPVRRALGVRTFFNILGPLVNPAGVERQLVGAFSPEVARQMAEVLARLGAVRAITVHAGGMDEFSLHAPATFYRVDGKAVEEHALLPEALGFRQVPLEALKGGNAQENASILQQVLSGQEGPYREVVLLNAAYALYISGKYDDLDTALQAAVESIDSGAAARKLKDFIAITHEAPAPA